jgi:hypothetical protein
MRFFRIPSFTGIESHRDDADRGTLRMAEGCVPSGPGGLRSGPVWQDLGKVSIYSTGTDNQLSGADDGKGNSLLFASRAEIIHDVKCFPTANTTMVSLGNTYPVATAALGVSIFASDNAYLSAIGNRSIGWGDGSDNALFGGKGPVNYADHLIYPNNDIYSMEYSWFPKCRFFVVGPNKCIYASGNPGDKLMVYITEPAGLTVPVRDSPYSTSSSKEGTSPGALSTVEILMSDATEITALSNRGNQVIVHTDAGAFLLYAPTPDQAEDGYRVAQAPSTVTSAGVNQSVTGGEDGTQPYYLGHDGQIYKDEASSRGSEETDRYSDPDQVSWKSKGRWEDEHPEDLSKSFAAYEPEIGQYWVYLENEEHAAFVTAGSPEATLVLIADADGILFPTAAQAPTDVSATEQIIAPTAAQAPTNVTATAVAPTAAQAPTNVTATEQIIAPTAAQAPTNVTATEDVIAPTAAQAPTNVTATEQIIAPTAAQAPTNVTATEQLDSDLILEPYGAQISGQSLDYLGDAVAIAKNTPIVIVGADRWSSDTGYAAVYELPGGPGSNVPSTAAWVQKGTTITGTTTGELAGHNVDINHDGTVIAVNSPEAPIATKHGHTQVYSMGTGATDWSPIGNLIVGQSAGDKEGSHKALSLVSSTDVQSPWVRVAVSGNLDTRVFELPGGSGTWVQVGSTIAGALGNGTRTSLSLNNDGTMLVIGDGEVASCRVYELSAGEWAQKGADFAITAVPWDVDINSDGTRVVVGYKEYGGSFDKGAFDVFELPAGASTWTRAGSFFTGNTDEQLGASVSITDDGNRIAIGAPQDFVTQSGRVRMYNWDTNAGDWAIQSHPLIPGSVEYINGTSTFEQFGMSSDMTGDGAYVVAGAPYWGNAVGVPAKGAVRVFY